MAEGLASFIEQVYDVAPTSYSFEDGFSPSLSWGSQCAWFKVRQFLKVLCWEWQRLADI